MHNTFFCSFMHGLSFILLSTARCTEKHARPWRELRAKDIARVQANLEDLTAKEKRGLSKEQKEEKEHAQKVLEFLEGGTDIRSAPLNAVELFLHNLILTALALSADDAAIWLQGFNRFRTTGLCP